MDLVELGPGKLDPKSNALLLQAKGIDHGGGDAPDYGPVPSMSALGLACNPWPKDAKGVAQGVVESVPGLDGVCLGAWDVRCSPIYGRLAPGDTALFSVGPQQAAQVLCKETKRQVVCATKDTEGKTVAFILDGKNDKVQIAAFGHIFQIDRDGLSITAGGATLLMQNGTFYFLGRCVFGGMTPFLPVLAGASGPAGIATPGVFVGK